MAHRKLAVAVGLMLAASSAQANVPAPARAPDGSPETRYCMRIEAITGSRLEKVRCWTRDEWAAQGVDVDKDWVREGVRTIG